MKTIGLLGGMSWESSLLYYKLINEYTNDILKKQSNAKSLMITVNFQEIEILQHQNKWSEALDILIEACLKLQKADVDFIIICTNTMHKLLPQIQKVIKTPFLHIAKATSLEINKQNISKVGLIGTKFTIQEDFYKNVLIENGIEVVIPNEIDMQIIHNIIYNELCLGDIKESSKNEYIRIVNSMPNIDGIILGCTEIGLLLSQDDFGIKVFDTTKIHAFEAVQLSLEK